MHVPRFSPARLVPAERMLSPQPETVHLVSVSFHQTSTFSPDVEDHPRLVTSAGRDAPVIRTRVPCSRDPMIRFRSTPGAVDLPQSLSDGLSYQLPYTDADTMRQ